MHSTTRSPRAKQKEGWGRRGGGGCGPHPGRPLGSGVDAAVQAVVPLHHPRVQVLAGVELVEDVADSLLQTALLLTMVFSGPGFVCFFIWPRFWEVLGQPFSFRRKAEGLAGDQAGENKQLRKTII